MEEVAEDKKNVLVLSEEREDAKGILKTYYSSEEFEPRLVFDSDDVLLALLNNSYQLLVFNVDEFQEDRLNYVLDLRLIGAEFPVLTLANQMSENSFKDVSKYEKALLLQKPCDEQQLLRVSSKMAQGNEEIAQRWHERFPTDEQAVISKFGSNFEQHNVKVKNLSKRGALLACPRNTGLVSGDVIKLDFNLTDIKKEHCFYAEIAWHKDDFSRNTLLLGVRFIKEPNHSKRV
tara:strand:+ start:26435 stop:27133 length:699 start_codon:yes stop_codon:yes gene_type:complete